MEKCSKKVKDWEEQTLPVRGYFGVATLFGKQEFTLE